MYRSSSFQDNFIFSTVRLYGQRRNIHRGPALCKARQLLCLISLWAHDNPCEVGVIFICLQIKTKQNKNPEAVGKDMFPWTLFLQTVYCFNPCTIQCFPNFLLKDTGALQGFLSFPYEIIFAKCCKP